MGVAELHASEGGAVMSSCDFRSVRNMEALQKRFGTKDSVRCSEFRDGRFSEFANVLQVWDFHMANHLFQKCARKHVR